MRALGASRTSLVPGGVLAGPWVRDPLWRNARAVPSLDLRFADNKSLVDAVSGQQLITFTRASSGTVTDSAGVLQTAATDVPRFDHNPTTGESLGLLVEEQRSNLLLRSEEFDTTWTRSTGTGETAISTNSIASPSGPVTADLFTAVNSGAATRFTVQSASKAASALIYTYSIYLKAKEITFATFSCDDGLGNGFSGGIDLTTGATSGAPVGIGATFSSVAAVPVGNGWYRCSVTGTSSSVPTVRVAVNFATSLTTGFPSVTVNASDGFYLWGAQLEAGAFPTSYIPTTTATVTRSADVASITGSAFSGFYNQSEGTVFLSGVMAPVITRFPAEFSLNDGTSTNQISAYNFTNLFAATVRKTGEVNTDPGLGTSPVSGANYKKAVAIKLSDYRIAANGAQGASVNPAFVPTVDRLAIGTNQGGGANINSTISRLTYWPTRLANSTLQSITQ